MSTVPRKKTPPATRLLLDVDWRTYCRLLKVFEEGPRVKMTYDRGRLEIVSPLLIHDNDADWLGTLVYVLTEELGLQRMSGGSVTHRRKQLKRGLEPDRCYWIANEGLMRGKKRLD